MKKLLPIGSIVLLRDSNRKLMITGRLQKEANDENENKFDYSACIYPEGNLGPESSFLFNHEDIERIYFIGFQDEEELEYNKKISEYLNKNIE